MLIHDNKYKDISILLAGDDDATMYSLYVTLKIQGISRILHCRSLSGVRRIIARSSPAVLFYDVDYRKDDLSWLRHLKLEDPGEDPLVVAIVAGGLSFFTDYIRRGVIFDIIRKPVEEEVLLTKLIRTSQHRKLLNACRKQQVFPASGKRTLEIFKSPLQQAHEYPHAER